MPNLSNTPYRWEHPVIQSCGHTTEANVFRERVLRAENQYLLSCDTCKVPIAPWAAPNHALREPHINERWRDVIGPFPAVMPCDLSSWIATRIVVGDKHIVDHKVLMADDETLTARLRHPTQSNHLGNILFQRGIVRAKLGKVLSAYEDLLTAAELSPSTKVDWRWEEQMQELQSRLPSMQEQASIKSTDAPQPFEQEGFGECPLAAELMYEPVSLSCGHTYERETLLKNPKRYFCYCCHAQAMMWHIPNYELRALIGVHVGAGWGDRKLPREGYRLNDPMPLGAFKFDDLNAKAERLLLGVREAFEANKTNICSREQVQAWLKDLGKALHFNPLFSLARLLRAEILAWSGDISEAFADIADTALASVPARAVANILSTILQHHGCIKVLEAIDILRKGDYAFEWRDDAVWVLMAMTTQALDKNTGDIDKVPRFLRQAADLGQGETVCRMTWEAIRSGAATLDTLCHCDDVGMRTQLLQFVAKNGEYESEAVAANWRMSPGGTEPESREFRDAKAEVWARYVVKNPHLPTADAVGWIISALESSTGAVASNLMSKVVKQAIEISGRCAVQNDVNSIDHLYLAINGLEPGFAKYLDLWLKLDADSRQDFTNHLSQQDVKKIYQHIAEAKKILNKRTKQADFQKWNKLLKQKIADVESKLPKWSMALIRKKVQDFFLRVFRAILRSMYPVVTWWRKR